MKPQMLSFILIIYIHAGAILEYSGVMNVYEE